MSEQNRKQSNPEGSSHPPNEEPQNEIPQTFARAFTDPDHPLWNMLKPGKNFLPNRDLNADDLNVEIPE